MESTNNLFLRIRKRVLSLFFRDNCQLRFIVGVGAFVLSIGFLVSSTFNSNYVFINDLASKRVWGIMFLIHSLIMMYTAFIKPVCQKVLLSLISFNGVGLWLSVFISFVILDETEIYATEWLLLLPIIVELWILISEIFRNDQKCSRLTSS